MPTPDESAAPSSRRRISRLVLLGILLGALGVVLIGVLVVREVASIRESEREVERLLAELDREADAGGPYPWNVDGEEDDPGVVDVRLAEVQRQGPGIEGRYTLDVGKFRWALDLPATDADEATWAAWEEESRPRWAALARALRGLADSGVRVRAEIFAPWKSEPEALPERLVLRLLPILAASGILDVDVDVEEAPPDRPAGD